MSEVIITAQKAPAAIPVHVVREGAWDAFSATLSAEVRAAAALAKFSGKARQIALVPAVDGAVAQVLFGLADKADAMALRALSAKLPPGDYGLATIPDGMSAQQASLAWALGSYRFDRYKQNRGDHRARLRAGPRHGQHAGQRHGTPAGGQHRPRDR